MKKIFLLIMVAIILIIAVFRPSYLVMVGGDVHKSKPLPDRVNSFQKDFIAPRDIIHFLDSNAPCLAEKEIDRYLLQIITLQKNYQKYYERKVFSDALNPKINQYKYQDLVALHNIREENIKNLIQNIYADGFKLSTSEGMVYIEIDYPKLRDEFGRYASNAVNGYLKIMATETVRHFSEDAGLIISQDALGGRIVAIEAYSRRYPRFSRLDEVKKLYKMYLPAYLIGLNNTPAFSYETNRLDERFFKSYGNSMKLYKGTQFARIIQEYLKLLERNDYQKTQDVLDFVGKVQAKG